MSNFYVYQYTRCTPSEYGQIGTPYYIGKGSQRRAYRKNAIEIRRPQDESNIVILFKDLPEDEAFRIEQDLIKLHGRIDLGTGCLRNKTDGGEGGSGAIRTAEMKARVSAVHKGLMHTAEAKAKMSLSRTGQKRSQQTKDRIGEAHRGKKKGPIPEERKARISASLKGRPKPEGFGAKTSLSNSRRIITPATKAKISASLVGKKRSLESRIKQSETSKMRGVYNKGKHPSEEVRAKMRNASRLRWERHRESNEPSSTSVKLKF